jgi:hypothetical protein
MERLIAEWLCCSGINHFPDVEANVVAQDCRLAHRCDVDVASVFSNSLAISASLVPETTISSSRVFL